MTPLISSAVPTNPASGRYFRRTLATLGRSSIRRTYVLAFTTEIRAHVVEDLLQPAEDLLGLALDVARDAGQGLPRLQVPLPGHAGHQDEGAGLDGAREAAALLVGTKHALGQRHHSISLIVVAPVEESPILGDG
jgi:hypothetical protein